MTRPDARLARSLDEALGADRIDLEERLMAGGRLHRRIAEGERDDQ
jgi:hypothetical protein